MTREKKNRPLWQTLSSWMGLVEYSQFNSMNNLRHRACWPMGQSLFHSTGCFRRNLRFESRWEKRFFCTSQAFVVIAYPHTPILLFCVAAWVSHWICVLLQHPKLVTNAILPKWQKWKVVPEHPKDLITFKLGRHRCQECTATWKSLCKCMLERTHNNSVDAHVGRRRTQ